MNCIAMLVALVLVVFAVSMAISAQSGMSLVIATALVAGGVLAHKFIQSFATNVSGAPTVSDVGQFLACVARNVLRLGIGAVVIAWMVVSAIWFFGA
jgi:hypothetical protein